MKRKMIINFLKAIRGLFYWYKLSKICQLRNNMVILIPEKNEKICYCVALYLNDLLIQRNKEKAIILSIDDCIEEYINIYTLNVQKIIHINQKEVENLMYLYRLYNFNENFLVASFNQPFGKNGNLLFDEFLDDFEELFAVGVFRLKPYNDRNEQLLKKEDAYEE